MTETGILRVCIDKGTSDQDDIEVFEQWLRDKIIWAIAHIKECHSEGVIHDRHPIHLIKSISLSCSHNNRELEVELL